MNKYFELLVKWTDISIVSVKKCKYCNNDFWLLDIEKKLYDKEGFKYPEQCSECTFKLLFSSLNDRHLYIREDTEKKNKLISILSENYEWDVFEVNRYKDYLTDDYALMFWQEISDDIFWNFSLLYEKFPKPSRLTFPELENGEYSSHSGWAKNVYLSYCIFTDCEDIYYSFRVLWWCKDVFNSDNIVTSTNVYYSSTIWTSHWISYCNTVVDSSNLLFCREMANCTECIFCCNQVNKKYMIYNVEYSREEYSKIKEDIFSRIKKYKDFLFLQDKYENFLESNLIVQSMDTNNCDRVVWETTYNSSNSVNVFICNWLEKCANIMNWGDSSDDVISDIYSSVELWERCQNSIWCSSFGVDTYNVFFSKYVTESSNIYYSIDVENSKEIMFSVWIRNKKYCIFNKVYEKKEYFKFKEEIINKLKKENKWWDFLWFDMSLYPYNDTLAYDFFKVHKVIDIDWNEVIINENTSWIVRLLWKNFITDAILDLWWEKINIKWRTKNKEINIPENMDSINVSDLPDIEEVGDSILEKVIICEKTWRPFRIVKKELDFLKKKWFPLPRIHHEERIDYLINVRPTWRFYEWTCDNCDIEVLTVFNEKQKCRVYCQDCYKNIMYK